MSHTIPQSSSQVNTETCDLSLQANTPTTSQVILQRLTTGRRVSVDGLEVSNDSISEVIGALRFLAAEEAVKARGGFAAMRKEIAVPPSANGGFRYRFGDAYAYRHPRWY